ncbi:SDR family NAD(P)-dependent oxidoreductase, partial [Streptomyces sp. NPDC053367]|uniref:SDR family NAD(P)-dependent oxidoreductase n=1 Tax=Streptomyces sp. NPDC053367 TaxID=3365700 RepID=UPI0037D7D056
EVIDTSRMDAEYWFTNLRRTVRLEESVRALAGAGHRLFVEVSAHPVLVLPVQEAVPDAVVLGTLRRGEGGPERVVRSLAEAFVSGAGVDWSAVYGRGVVVDLPTYAFQRERYWLETDTAPEQVAADPVEAAFWEAVETQDLTALVRELDVEQESLSDVLPALAAWRQRRRTQSVLDSWRYHVTWAPLPDPAPATLTGTWLLAVEEGGADSTLAEFVRNSLTAGGAQVALVEVGGEADRAAVADRLREATGEAGAAGVVSLLGLAGEPHPAHPGVPRGLALTLALIQALGDAGTDARLWCVTRGAVAAGASDRLDSPAQAAVWGLGRVAALEHPQQWGGLVDLPAEPDEATARRLRAALAGLADEDQLALRPTGVLARRLVRASAAATSPVGTWTPRGTVLLTGGTGGIGAQIARWLARNGAEHLVLTSRSGPDAPGADKLAAELTELGARVTVAACDVTDLPALRDLVARVESEGPAIRTVMHIAGAGVLVPLAATHLEQFAGTTTAKIAGAANLDTVFGHAGLDAFVLFSSISAVWGSGEHGAYAAANAYLDGLAEQRRARGLPATSVVWGIWSPEEGGMAANLAEEQLRGRGIPFMSPELAIDGFQQVLDRDETVVVVADVDWTRFVPVFTSARPSPLLGQVPEVARILAADARAAQDAADESGSLRDQLAGLPPAERDAAVLALVRTQIAAVLGYPGSDAVDSGRAFRELGFDSLSAVDLRNRLGATTGLRFPVTVVFDYPSARDLARHVTSGLFPEGAAAIDDGLDPEDAEIRRILTSVPLARLREAGLLEELRRLADPAGQDPGPDAEPAESIDELDVEDLVRLAYDKNDL